MELIRGAKKGHKLNQEINRTIEVRVPRCCGVDDVFGPWTSRLSGCETEGGGWTGGDGCVNAPLRDSMMTGLDETRARDER